MREEARKTWNSRIKIQHQAEIKGLPEMNDKRPLIWASTRKQSV